MRGGRGKLMKSDERRRKTIGRKEEWNPKCNAAEANSSKFGQLRYVIQLR